MLCARQRNWQPSCQSRRPCRGTFIKNASSSGSLCALCVLLLCEGSGEPAIIHIRLTGQFHTARWNCRSRLTSVGSVIKITAEKDSLFRFVISPFHISHHHPHRDHNSGPIEALCCSARAIKFSFIPTTHIILPQKLVGASA